MDFTIDEYKMRINRTKQKMQERGIEVLIITNPSNMNYLTGYNVWSFYVPQFIILTIDEDDPTWIGREMDANSAKLTSWLKDESIIPYSDDYVQSEFKHPMHFVADFLIKQNIELKTVGVEMETHFFSARFYKELMWMLPESKIEDASVLVNWVRLIKSDQEIDYMKKAAKIVEKAMQVGFERLNVGVRGCDVAAEIIRAQIKGFEDFGGDYSAIVPLIPAGEETSAPHMTWSERRYKKDDPVIIEIAGCHKRYHSPMARTVVLGEANDKLIDLSKVINYGIEEVIHRTQPGMTSEQIEEVFRETIKKHGIIKDSRLGYSVGLSYPPDWGEHTVSIRNGDKTVIEPNMTLHFIPGIWYDNYGCEISETIRITDNGCETLANFPRDLYIKQ